MNNGYLIMDGYKAERTQRSGNVRVTRLSDKKVCTFIPGAKWLRMGDDLVDEHALYVGKVHMGINPTSEEG